MKTCTCTLVRRLFTSVRIFQLQWIKPMNQNRNEPNLRLAALIYDFDGTLAPGNMQEHSFIPAVDMTKKDFWDEVKACSKKEDADEILVYMRLMIEKANQKCLKITREDLRKHGGKIPLFEGLKDKSWFDRINCHAATNGLKIGHYIISSGLEEMIRGCSISQVFHHVFASKFIYEDDIPKWPGSGDQLHDQNTISFPHQ